MKDFIEGIILLFFLAWSLQSVVRCVTEYWRRKILAYIESTKDDCDKNPLKDDLEKEAALLKLTEVTHDPFGEIRTIISWIELILFTTLTLALLRYDNQGLVDLVKTLGVASSGWIALKIFGNYKQWGGPRFGRILSYVFLLGSIMNIVGSIALGYLAKILLLS